MHHFSKYTRYLLIGVLYLILITPLLLSSKFLFPFITTKTVFFRTAVEVAGFLFIILALVDSRYRPKMNLLQWLIVAFGGLILITGITGVNFYKSFWGTIERGEGFLTVSHVLGYCLLLTWVFKSKKEWFNFLTGTVLVSVVVCAYALKQKFSAPGSQVKFLWFNLIHPGEGRLAATIGNAAFMGAYTLASFYISLLLFVARKHWWKLVYGFTGLFNLYILYYTQTRGAWIGLIVSLLILGLVFIFKSKDKRVKLISSGAILFMVILFSIFYACRNQDWVKNSGTIHRLVNISKKSITVESRLMAWDSSWRGWKDRFVLGYGWENYNIAFNKYFHPEIFKDSGSQLWFDRAHNTIFDVAVATGIFGLLVYLAMFIVALYYLYKIFISRNQYSNLALILACALIAHFVQNIFVFDVLASYIMIFSMLGLAVFFRQAHIPDQEQEHYLEQPNIIIGAISLIILVFFVFIFNIKPAQANKKGVEALIAFKLGKINIGVATFKDALNMNTYQTPELRQKLAENILLYNKSNKNLNPQEISDNYRLAIRQIKKNIEAAPKDVQNYLYLTALLNATRLSSNLEKIETYGKKALELSPTRPQTYFEMGQAKMALKEHDRGIEYFKKGVDLAPWAIETHWNLAAAYIISGQAEKADQIFQRLAAEDRFDYNSEANLGRILKIYVSAGNKQKIKETLEKLAALSPTNSDYWAKLAAIYKELGELEKSRQAVLKAVEIDPDQYSQEAEKFLKLLDEQSANQAQGPQPESSE